MKYEKTQKLSLKVYKRDVMASWALWCPSQNVRGKVRKFRTSKSASPAQGV